MSRKEVMKSLQRRDQFRREIEVAKFLGLISDMRKCALLSKSR